ARRTDHEALVFLAHGLAPDLEIEGESALWTTATQEKSPLDPSPMPSRLRESGLGDTEGQLRWRILREGPRRPELFSLLEVVLPLQRDRKLIGTQGWELSPGLGLIRGGRFGTWTARVTASWTPDDGTFELGETSLEWSKRVAPLLKAVAAV